MLYICNKEFFFRRKSYKIVREQEVTDINGIVATPMSRTHLFCSIFLISNIMYICPFCSVARKAIIVVSLTIHHSVNIDSFIASDLKILNLSLNQLVFLSLSLFAFLLFFSFLSFFVVVALFLVVINVLLLFHV